MTHNLARIIREVRDNGAWPWKLAIQEGYTGLDGPNGLRAALEKEGIVDRHTPNYPDLFPDFEGGKWYLWPKTPEAARKWNLPDDITLYLPLGLLTEDGAGYRMPDGRHMASHQNEELYWGGGKYAVDQGSSAAIGELVEGYIHDGYGSLSFCRGVVPERYIPIAEFRAKRRALAMSDGEYELAIGEGIPAGSPLLETKDARKARAKLAGLEVA